MQTTQKWIYIYIQNAEQKNGLRKQNATIPTHPNKYTGSELFWENLTQYSIPTLP